MISRKLFEIVMMIGVVDAVDGNILQVEVTPVPYANAESTTVTIPDSIVPCDVYEGMTFYIDTDLSSGEMKVTCPVESEPGC